MDAALRQRELFGAAEYPVRRGDRTISWATSTPVDGFGSPVALMDVCQAVWLGLARLTSYRTEQVVRYEDAGADG